MGDNFFDDLQKIKAGLVKIPKFWDGKTAILEMKNAGGKHWRQMEWMGFYFEFLCEKYLKNVLSFHEKKYGNVSFDGFGRIPLDFKAHAMNTNSHKIIVNDLEAILSAVEEFGVVGLVIAVGKVKYNDEARVFQKWHQVLKGGKSKYEKDRIARGAWSRLRKVSVDLAQISFLKIDEKVLEKAGSFQKDFRNSGGGSRREKLLIDLEKMDENIVDVLEF